MFGVLAGELCFVFLDLDGSKYMVYCSYYKQWLFRSLSSASEEMSSRELENILVTSKGDDLTL